MENSGGSGVIKSVQRSLQYSNRLTYVQEPNKIQEIHHSDEDGKGLNRVVKHNVVNINLASGDVIERAWVFDRIIATLQ